MSFHDAIYYETQNSAGITAVVGTRVFLAGDVPQESAQPYLVLQRISGIQEDHQGGDALIDARYQFSCVGATLSSARSVAAAVITEFKHYRGAMGEVGSTVNVRDAQIENDADAPIYPTGGSERGPQMYIVDIRFIYAA